MKTFFMFISSAAKDLVVSIATSDVVVTVLPVNHIISRSTIDRVAVVATVDVVVAATSINVVTATVTPDQVSFITTTDDVVSGAAEDPISAATAIKSENSGESGNMPRQQRARDLPFPRRHELGFRNLNPWIQFVQKT